VNTTSIQQTPVQTWLVAAFDVLDRAKAELNPVEYETLLDVIAARRYVARLGLVDERRPAA
jgi:hypothetical protein